MQDAVDTMGLELALLGASMAASPEVQGALLLIAVWQLLN